MKKYIVRLNESERVELTALVKTGKAAAFKRQRAQILLLADVDRPEGSYRDEDIAKLLSITTRTVERVRRRLVEQGFEQVLEREPRQAKARRLDGEQEAWLVALSCSETPPGRNRWSLTLLQNKLIALEQVESISRETIRQVLKKRHQTLAASGVVYSR